MGQGKGIIFLLDGEGEGTATGLLWVRLSRKTKSVDPKAGRAAHFRRVNLIQRGSFGR